MKLLIIRFSSIGDIVLTSPIFRCLRAEKESEIHFLTKKQYAMVMEHNPYIDKIHTIGDDVRLTQLLPQLKKEGFDAIIDLHKNLRTLRVRWKLGIKTYSFPKLNFQKFLLTKLGLNRMPNVHIVDRYFKAVQPLGIINDKLGLDYFIPDTTYVNLASNGLEQDKYVALVVGAAHATKRLPIEKLKEFCATIKQPVAILGGKEDIAVGRILAKEGTHLVDFCGKLSLHESAYVLREARLVVTHDTGLMHIAAALKKDIISIWGSTVPEFGMYPYYPKGDTAKHVIIENKQISCRPCSKIGYKKCPKGHFNCMQQLAIKAVAKDIDNQCPK